MERNDVVIFVSNKRAQCGVYEFGRSVAEALRASRRYEFVYAECSSAEEYHHVVHAQKPVAIIYNYYPSTLNWLNKRHLRRHHGPHIGIIHEVTQEVADKADTSVFDFHIAPDPTLLLRNARVFKTGRLVPRYVGRRFEEPPVCTIGSFGFATPGKGFEELVIRVQNEFDEALIKLRIPFATFADEHGESAQATAARCLDLVRKPNVGLDIRHDFMTTEEVLEFLAGNSLNAFLYDSLPGRGISSVIDFALSVGRPLALTRCMMFRHVINAKPSITVEDAPLREILKHGAAPIARFAKEWTADNLVWDYERIVTTILADTVRPTYAVLPWASEVLATSALPPASRESIMAVVEKTTEALAGATHQTASRLGGLWHGAYARELARRHPTAARQARKLRGRLRSRGRSNSSGRSGPRDWVPRPAVLDVTRRAAFVERYEPIPSVSRFNRILDASAHELYAPTLEYLYRCAPELMAKKIPAANIQQAFVLDTVLRHVRTRERSPLLCVGSFEDTAAAAIAANGYELDELDPVLNYDLATYMTRPSCRRDEYAGVFATSVIEHVANDEDFVMYMEELLAVGGLGVLTCDFRDNAGSEDRIPSADLRLYSAEDLHKRLIPKLERSELIDTPEWGSAHPWFVHDGCRYTFAAMVFRRVR